MDWSALEWSGVEWSGVEWKEYLLHATCYLQNIRSNQANI